MVTMPVECTAVHSICSLSGFAVVVSDRCRGGAGVVSAGAFGGGEAIAKVVAGSHRSGAAVDRRDPQRGRTARAAAAATRHPGGPAGIGRRVCSARSVRALCRCCSAAASSKGGSDAQRGYGSVEQSLSGCAFVVSTGRCRATLALVRLVTASLRSQAEEQQAVAVR
jgi:hypothetical protein